MPEGFEALEVWQVAYALRLMVHKRIAPALPQHEQWDLCRQIRRASKSMGANIAEGNGRYYFARDLGYIETKLYTEARNLADSNYRLLNGYIAYLKKRKFGADEPGANVALADGVHGNLENQEPEDAPTPTSPAAD